MQIYNVTFIHEYWHITTTIEHDGRGAHWHDEAVEMAADWIMGTSGLDLTKYNFIDIDVEYAGEVV